MNSDKRGRTAVLRPRAERFRMAIESAEGEGVARADMVLHLTHRDTAGLKRDRTVPVEDISFAGGVMLFLGVPVVSGGAEESFLDKAGAVVIAGAPAATASA